jgi:acyl carrier protein
MENALKMVRDVIEDATGIEAEYILTGNKLRDLVSDSLEYASMLQDLEDEFGIDAEDIAKLGTVGALVARLNDSDSYT